VTVAKANIASLFHFGAVSAAGLEILEAHVGGFDAKSPSHPHRVRTVIEEEIEREHTKATELRKLGRNARQHLVLIAEIASGDSREFELSSDSLAAVKERFLAVLSAKNRVAAAIEGDSNQKCKIVRALPGFNVWTVSVQGAPVGLVHVGADGSFVGFYAPLSSEDGPIIPVVGVIDLSADALSEVADAGDEGPAKEQGLASLVGRESAT